MNTNKSGGKWWLAAIPAALLCLPCILPALIAAGLVTGGAGALGSFLAGTGGLVALVLAALLIAAAAVIYFTRNRWRRGGVTGPLPLYDAPPPRAGRGQEGGGG